MVTNWTFGTGSDAFPSESGLPARAEEREAEWRAYARDYLSGASPAVVAQERRAFVRWWATDGSGYSSESPPTSGELFGTGEIPEACSECAHLIGFHCPKRQQLAECEDWEPWLPF